MLCLFIDSPYFIKFNHIWAYYMNLIWNTIESYDIKYDLDTALIHPIHIHLLAIICAVFSREMIGRDVLPIICAVFAREMIGRGVLPIIWAVFSCEMIGRDVLPIICKVFAREMIDRDVLPIICAVFAREMIDRDVLPIICKVFAREMIGRLAQASNIREISCRWGQSKSLTPTPTHFVKDINI